MMKLPAGTKRNTIPILVQITQGLHPLANVKPVSPQQASAPGWWGIRNWGKPRYEEQMCNLLEMRRQGSNYVSNMRERQERGFVDATRVCINAYQQGVYDTGR
jgi:hypothetical protein